METSADASDLRDIPAYVENVHFDGIERTRRDLLAHFTEDLFKCTNFRDMVVKAHAVKGRLDALGIFSHTRVLVGAAMQDAAYDVTFDLKEVNRVTGSFDVSTGKSDSTLSATLNMPNTFGRCEHLAGSYSVGLRDKTFSLKGERPLGRALSDKLGLELFSRTQEHPCSGYKLTGLGVCAELMTNSLFGGHRLSWEGIWRGIGALGTSDVAFDVRKHFGDSLKSSLKHVFSLVTCENLLMPSQGISLTLTQELAGLGGGVRFFSNELTLRGCSKLFDKYFAEVTLAAGLLKGSGKTLICDRFLHGGPMILRGFKQNGVGPFSDGAAMGGDVYWTANAHFYFPFPFLSSKHVFNKLFTFHTFVNSGALSGTYCGLFDLAKKYRLSAGVGLAGSFSDLCRFEFNFVFPIVSLKNDKTADGFQFGLGINF